MINKFDDCMIRGQNVQHSEAGRESGERDSNWIIVGQSGDEFVVATAQVLDERAPGCDNAQRSDRLYSSIGRSRALNRP